jgi:hypothetical protein
MQVSSKHFLMAAALFSVCSCGPQVVPSSGPRPPLSADAVKIYENKPHKYEELGKITLEITPDLGWDQHANADKAFDIMKAKAAALGANGLLLDVDPGGPYIKTEAGYHGTFYHFPMQGKIVTNEAIFVLEE